MSKKSRSSPAGSRGDSCLMPFHHIVDLTVTGAAGAISCNPTGLSSRALSEADNWAHFRLLRFKFRILPQDQPPVPGTTDLIRAVAGYCGAVEDTPPATAADIMELLPSTYMPGSQTIPTKWVTVSPKELAGAFPWYKTIPGTADSTEEAPGQLCHFDSAAGSTSSYVIEWMGVFEFKTSVSATNTPLAAKLRQVVRDERKRAADEMERKKLQQVLAPQPSAKTQTMIFP